MYTRIKQWPIFLTTAIVCVLMGQVGMLNGWTSPELPYLEDESSPIPTTSSQGSTIAVIKVLGEILSNPIAVLCNEKLGRKFVIFSSIIPFMSCWVLTAFSKSVLHLMIARFIGGIGEGFIIIGGPIYLGEVSTDDIKGSLVSCLLVAGNIGVVFIYIAGLNPELWFPPIFCIIPLILISFLIFWFPESPYFLLKQNKKDQALKSLQKIRNKDDVLEEFNSIKLSENKLNFKEFFQSKGNYKPLLICLTSVFICQFSGGVTLTMNTHIIFQRAGDISMDLLSITRAIIQLISSIVVTCIIDKVKRRLFLICCCSLVTIVTAVKGTYFLLQDQNYNLETIWWVPILCLSIYNICITFVQSIQLVYIAELFHPKMRSCALGIAWLSSSIFTIIVGKFFQILIDAYSMCVPFYLFSLVGLFGLVFVYFVVPETKNKSLEDIQYYFEHNSFKNSDNSLQQDLNY